MKGICLFIAGLLRVAVGSVAATCQSNIDINELFASERADKEAENGTS